jgi:TetR/AcrR family transcriptional regulator
MPKPAFFQLPANKQARIVAAAQTLFASAPYALASTNVLVKACGISKGSLFNYFEDKTDLYLYVLQQAHHTLAQAFADPNRFSSDLLTRFCQWAHLSMNVWQSHPECYALFQQFTQAPEALQQQYIKQQAPPFKSFFRAAFETVDTQCLNYPLEDCLALLEWAMVGLHQELAQQWQSDTGPEEREKHVMAHTQKICKMLRTGLYTS